MFHILAWVSKILEMKKTSKTVSARASSAALKRRRLRYFSQMDRLPPVFGLAFRRKRLPRLARDTDLNSSSRGIEMNLSEICHHQRQHELLWGICRFFYEKFG